MYKSTSKVDSFLSSYLLKESNIPTVILSKEYIILDCSHAFKELIDIEKDIINMSINDIAKIEEMTDLADDSVNRDYENIYCSIISKTNTITKYKAKKILLEDKILVILDSAMITVPENSSELFQLRKSLSEKNIELLQTKSKLIEYEKSLENLLHSIPDSVLANTANINSIQDMANRKNSESLKQNLLLEMGERIKELSCIKSISHIVIKDNSVDEIFNNIANVIPEGFQYPYKTSVKISYNDKTFCSDSFQETSYKIESFLHTNGKEIGKIEVFYPQDSANVNGTPFLNEEQELIDNVAIIVSETISKKIMEDRLFSLNIELEKRVDERTGELAATTSRLELAVKAGGIGVWEWDGLTEEIKWDKEMCSLYSLEQAPENLSLSFWLKIVHPDDRKKTYDKLHNSLKSEDEFSTDFRVIWPDNSVHHIKSIASIYRNFAGVPKRVVGVNWDITDEKKLSELIIKERKMLQNLLDNSPISVVITTKGIVQYANKLFAKTFGLTNGDLVYDSYVSIEDRNNVVKMLEHENQVLDYNIQGYDQDGNVIELIMNYIKMDYEGEPSLLVWIVDITRIAEFKKQLSDAKHSAENVIDYSPLPLLIINSETKEVIRYNQAFLDYNHIDKIEKIEPDNIFSDAEVSRAKIRKMFEADGVIQNEELLIKRIGTNEKSWILFSMYPFVYNSINSLAIIFMDINETHEYQLELAKAKDAALHSAQIAESASKAKSDFLANMSHEIRTPINAIMGFTDLMNNTSLSMKQADYVKKIDASSKILLHLINDILDFSKIEAGKMNIEETKFSIEAVLTQIKDSIAFKAFEKRIELVIDMDQNVPEYVIGDPLRLEQVLLNLTNNAIKFTQNGSVIIRVEVVEDGHDLLTLKFRIQDTGIGIEEHKLNELFKPFTQADASTTRRYGGTGLGLVISKNLVEMMGGEIGAVSQYEKGSEFYFTVKVYKFSGSENKKTYKMNVPKCSLDSKILVVIENSYTRNVFYKYLSQLETPPTLLSCGEEAIEELNRNDYDLVIMDCKMRGLDGVESWHIIRDMLDEDKIPKIIMVTSYGTPDIIYAAESEHVDEVIVKPVTQSRLYDAVLNLSSDKIYLTNSDESKKSGTIISSSEFEGVKILLVEDNEINQQVAKELLEIKGFEVDVADNGQNALDKLLINKDYEIILMDLQMPVMDGYEAAKSIRENDMYDAIPIIALSADAMKGTKEAALSAGMNDYITKPINQDELYSKLAKWDSKARNAKHNKDDIKKFGKNELIDLLPCLDADGGLERINNNIELFIKILKKFKSQYSNFGSLILELVNDGKNEEAIRQAHTLKGVAATIGAEKLNILSRELEALLKTADLSHESYRNYIDKINLEIQEIICEIDNTIKVINHV